MRSKETFQFDDNDDKGSNYDMLNVQEDDRNFSYNDSVEYGTEIYNNESINDETKNNVRKSTLRALNYSYSIDI